MNFQKTVIDFECDNCQKRKSNCENFPYERGWKYIHLFQYKDGTKSNIDQDKIKCLEIKDKHFCSDECMLEFIRKELKRKKEVKNENRIGNKRTTK